MEYDNSLNQRNQLKYVSNRCIKNDSNETDDYRSVTYDKLVELSYENQRSSIDTEKFLSLNCGNLLINQL